MSNNDVIQKVHHWCHKVLPLVYDDSLSYYELLCKLVHKVNELVDELSGWDDKILDVVREYVSSAEFTAYVGGLVATFVSERNTAPGTNDLDVHRIYSRLGKTSDKYPDSYDYTVPQSMCYNPDTNTLIVAFMADPSPNNLVRLTEFNLDNMSVVREATLSLFHANGMTFDVKKQKIYVCGLNEFTVDNKTGYGFIVVDYATLEYERSIHLSFNPIGCGMDEEHGLIYFTGAGYTVQVVNNENYLPVREFNLKIPKWVGSVYQDIDVHDGLIYCIFWRPNTINVFDLSGNNVVNYNIPKWMDKIYRFYEGESICHIGNGNFAISGYNLETPDHYRSEGVIGVCNFAKNVQNHPSVMLNYHSFQQNYEVWVDSTPANANNINPIGDKNSPFRSVQEALTSIRSPYFDGAVNIILVANGVEPAPILAVGVNKIVRFTGGPYTFNNFKANYCTKFVFNQDMSFKSTVKATGCIDLYRSDGLFHRCEVDKGECTYGFYLEDCRFISNMTEVVNKPDFYLLSCVGMINAYDDTTMFTLGNTQTVLNRPLLIAKGQFTSSFDCRFDPKMLPYTMIEVVCGNTGQVIELDSKPQSAGGIVSARFHDGTNWVDLFFNVSFNYGSRLEIFNMKYSLDGGELLSGFPPNTYIGSVKVRN